MNRRWETVCVHGKGKEDKKEVSSPHHGQCISAADGLIDVPAAAQEQLAHIPMLALQRAANRGRGGDAASLLEQVGYDVYMSSSGCCAQCLLKDEFVAVRRGLVLRDQRGGGGGGGGVIERF